MIVFLDIIIILAILFALFNIVLLVLTETVESLILIIISCIIVVGCSQGVDALMKKQDAEMGFVTQTIEMVVNDKCIDKNHCLISLENQNNACVVTVQSEQYARIKVDDTVIVEVTPRTFRGEVVHDIKFVGVKPSAERKE